MNIFMRRMAEDVPLMTMERMAWIVGATVSKDDIQAAEHPWFKQMRETMKPKAEVVGNVAIVPVEGTLAYNPHAIEMLWYGMEDSRSVLRMVNEAAGNPSIDGILLRMDTPGGMMLGGPEISDAVAASVKAGKPVVTHIGGLGASLGYLIAAPSTKIVANRSALVGSIGVISSVTDYTDYLKNLGISMEYFTNKEAKFKAAGAIGTSLTDEQRAYIQSRVDSAFAVFKDTVQTYRPKVKAGSMQGQVMRGDEALSAGLVDATGSEAFAMRVLQDEITKRRTA
jgi:protease-4